MFQKDTLLEWRTVLDNVLIGAELLDLDMGVARRRAQELLRRYGAQSFVSSVLDFADWTSARIGAFPRPLVVLLGIPALVWGTHVRARRRQGWWFCAFGVAALGEIGNAARRHCLPATERCQLGNVGRGEGGQPHQPLKPGDGGLVCQRRAAGSDHHRVEHHR